MLRKTISTAAVLLLAGTLLSGILTASTIQGEIAETGDMPNKLSEIPKWDPEENEVAARVRTLKEDIRSGASLINRYLDNTEDLAHAGNIRESFKSGDVETLVPIGHEAYREALRNTRNTEDREMDRDDWEQYAKNMVQNVLKLNERQADEVWNTIRNHRESREKKFEEMAGQFNERPPTDADLDRIGEQLTHQYRNQLKELESRLSSEQYNRFTNWMRSRSRRWTGEEVELEHGGEIEMTTLGESVQVEYREQNEQQEEE